MTDSKTEAAEMEKLLEELQDYNQSMILSVGAMVKETVSCGRANFATALISAYPKLNAYIRTLQSRNKVLEEDVKRMREAAICFPCKGTGLLNNQDLLDEECWKCDGLGVDIDTLRSALSSLHHSSDSVNR